MQAGYKTKKGLTIVLEALHSRKVDGKQYWRRTSIGQGVLLHIYFRHVLRARFTSSTNCLPAKSNDGDCSVFFSIIITYFSDMTEGKYIYLSVHVTEVIIVRIRCIVLSSYIHPLVTCDCRKIKSTCKSRRKFARTREERAKDKHAATLPSSSSCGPPLSPPIVVKN